MRISGFKSRFELNSPDKVGVTAVSRKDDLLVLLSMEIDAD
jgi:hypothetical protein